MKRQDKLKFGSNKNRWWHSGHSVASVLLLGYDFTAHDSTPPISYCTLWKASGEIFALMCHTAPRSNRAEDCGAEKEPKINPSTLGLKFYGQPGIMKAGIKVVQLLRLFTFFHQGFGAKAVCSGNLENSGQHLRIWYKQTWKCCLVWMNLSDTQHRDKNWHNCCRASIRLLLLLMLSNALRRNRTTGESRLRRDHWKWQTGGRQLCEWSGGQRLNRCLDRVAVIGVQPPCCDQTHLNDGSQLDIHVWLSGLGVQPSGSSALHHLLFVCINPFLIQHLLGIPTLP